MEDFIDYLLNWERLMRESELDIVKKIIKHDLFKIQIAHGCDMVGDGKSLHAQTLQGLFVSKNNYFEQL